MRKKIRLIILAICVILFFILAPYIVLYSMGYRVDFINKKIVATGGIYVRSYPLANQIIIDSKIEGKPGMFLNAFFVQNLLPKNHNVLVKKTGYFDYQKNIPVIENQVTKLENILLIKQNISFNLLAGNINYFSVSPDGKNILTAGPGTKSIGFEYFSLSNLNQKKNYSLPLQNAEIVDIKWSDNSGVALIKIQKYSDISYYIFDSSKTSQQTLALAYLDKNSQQIAFNPQNTAQLFYIENKILYSLKQNKPSAVIKNLLTYKILGNNILWLSSDGFLQQSDISGKLIQKITEEKIVVNPAENYEIIDSFEKTFLKKNNALLLLDNESKNFKDFNAPIDNYNLLFSPDGKNMVYFNNSEIYLYSFSETSEKKNVKLFFANSQETISKCFWVNNDYIIFESGNKIIISEIDYRGNINAVEVSQNYEKSADSKNPKIYYNGRDTKIYILNGNSLFSSEKITP